MYVCAVRDGCSRRGIGWAVDEHMHTDLIQAAPTMAVAMRGELAQQVILHADRGLSVHLAAAGRVRARAQPGPLSRPQSGVLGQRCGRIILDHRENRILRQQPKQPPSSRSATDRTSLQPTQAPLGHRYDQPGRLRRSTHSDGTSHQTGSSPGGRRSQGGTFTSNRAYNLASPGPADGSRDRRLASRQRKADALADPKETEIHRHQDGFGGVCAAASVR
jgi:hypothetical protein